MSLKENFAADLSTRAWVLVGFLLPINKSLAVVAVLLVGLLSWLSDDRKKNIQNLSTNRLLWLPPAYFLWHVITLFWSDNKVYGGHDIETKLSFILIPLLIGSTHPDLRQRLNFFLALTVGVILNGLSSIFQAFQEFEKDGLTSHFFYTELSKNIHVAYLTIMVNMCVLYLIYSLFFSEKLNPKPWSLFTALLLLSLLSVMLDSRTAFFTLLISGFGYFIVSVMKQHNVKKHLIGLLVFLVLFGAGYSALSSLHNRMAELSNLVKTIKEGSIKETEGQEADYGNAGVRPILWKNAIEVIKENPLGVGCGDLKDELGRKYEANSFYTGIKFKLNPHNQYLHTTVGTGFPGLILLFSMLFIPLRIAFLNKKWFTFSCLSVFILNAMTESILEVQNGILPFTVIYALLVSDLKEARVKE